MPVHVQYMCTLYIYKCVDYMYMYTFEFVHNVCNVQ